MAENEESSLDFFLNYLGLDVFDQFPDQYHLARETWEEYYNNLKNKDISLNVHIDILFPRLFDIFGNKFDPFEGNKLSRVGHALLWAIYLSKTHSFEEIKKHANGWRKKILADALIKAGIDIPEDFVIDDGIYRPKNNENLKP